MAHNTHAEGGHGENHSYTKTFVLVFIALCVLTSASIITYTPLWASIVSDNKQTAWAFMMAVSCGKAMLVISFFMHLLWEANWKYVLTIPAAMMSIFLMCMLVPDVGYRTRHYDEQREYHDAHESRFHEEHSEGHPAAETEAH